MSTIDKVGVSATVSVVVRAEVPEALRVDDTLSDREDLREMELEALREIDLVEEGESVLYVADWVGAIDCVREGKLDVAVGESETDKLRLEDLVDERVPVCVGESRFWVCDGGALSERDLVGFKLGVADTVVVRVAFVAEDDGGALRLEVEVLVGVPLVTEGVREALKLKLEVLVSVIFVTEDDLGGLRLKVELRVGVAFVIEEVWGALRLELGEALAERLGEGCVKVKVATDAETEGSVSVQVVWLRVPVPREMVSVLCDTVSLTVPESTSVRVRVAVFVAVALPCCASL